MMTADREVRQAVFEEGTRALRVHEENTNPRYYDLSARLMTIGQHQALTNILLLVVSALLVGLIVSVWLAR
jgi:hypothetical protein